MRASAPSQRRPPGPGREAGCRRRPMSRTEAAAANAAAASGAKLELKHEQDLLLHWLRADAYPLWATQGYDRVQGGFQEALTAVGPTAERPRRARVQARQIYSFSRAARP